MSTLFCIDWVKIVDFLKKHNFESLESNSLARTVNILQEPQYAHLLPIETQYTTVDQQTQKYISSIYSAA